MAIKALFNRSPSLSVTLSEELLFVHPTYQEPEEPTPGFSRDPMLLGTALLSLPSPRAVSRIKVVFEGLTDASAGSGYPYETTTSLCKELELDLKGEVVEAGKHAFNFSFIVPSSTAPYQRCNYGRTRHSVKATATFADSWSSSVVKSPPIAVYVTASPHGPGEAPQSMDLSLEHYSEDLGPVGVTFASPRLTVAALVNFRLTLLGAPTPLKIISCNVLVEQRFSITYTSGEVARPPARRYNLTKIEGSSAAPSLCVNKGITPLGATTNAYIPNDPHPPSADIPSPDPDSLADLGAGEAFQYSRTMRVDIDDYVRASTLEGTETPINVSHKLLIEVRYRVQGEKGDKIFLLGKDVVIGSCCGLADSLYLPAYSRCSPQTVLRPLDQRCWCCLDTKELMDRDGEALQRAGSIEEPSSEARILGQDKSPAVGDGAGRAMPSPALRSMELLES
ncbi:hypothetical protein BCR35DRAFT_299089 [Leucosporidium creatinivorum]|uniref:Arrestin-like N-terminal domain-containing protein n=1 Tax=Leucosporidium creatinivorum TaxID=106004 RepID=A0A1Y2G308_9BASI|nr:hypothetical protein BCR35DRAFT_299089 [Leucosporidium creatinivorum]